MNFFSKNTRLDEIKKLEKEYTSKLFSYSEKEYKNKLEELLYTIPNKNVRIHDSISEKDIEQIEILLLLSKLKNNSYEEDAMYLKEAINYGSLKACITFLNKFCHIYPEDSIKIFNLLNNCNESDLYNEVFTKEDSSNKDYFNHLKIIYLNSFVGISYLKLNNIDLAEKHLKIADEKIVSIPAKTGISIPTFNLGLINYNRGNFSEAKKYFEKCSLKEEESIFFLGVIAFKENDILSSIRYFSKNKYLYSSMINLITLKLKYFFSYSTINECIEILEKECLEQDKNLLGELYLIKKEITFSFNYKEKACYEFGYIDNINKLQSLLTKAIAENNLELLNGLAVLRNRLRINEEITNISIQASDNLKEIENFYDIEKDFVITDTIGNMQFKYIHSSIDI